MGRRNDELARHRKAPAYSRAIGRRAKRRDNSNRQRLTARQWHRPTNGSTATAVRVSNFFAQTFVDREWIDAVYSPGVSISPPADWETLKGGGAGQQNIHFR